MKETLFLYPLTISIDKNYFNILSEFYIYSHTGSCCLSAKYSLFLAFVCRFK